MKNFSFFLFITLISIIVSFTSCSSDSEPEPLPLEEKTRYYVKYEVEFKTQHTNTEKNISITTDKGSENISFTEWTKTIAWEGTYGPVNKDFIASINCSVPSYSYSSEIHARIYLSREKEPFVIKAEGKGEYILSLKSKIDF